MSEGRAPDRLADRSIASWPHERFYFALLDTSALPRRARTDEQKLGFLFESTLPAPIDEIAAAYAPISETRVVACGIERSVLQDPSLDGFRALVPDGVPEDLGIGAAFDPTRLNLLVGEFEPKSIASGRRRKTRILSVAWIAAAALVVFGVETRLSDLRTRAVQIESQEALLLDAALGKPRVPVPAGQRRMQLLGELRKLERTRTTTGRSGALEVPDAADRLAELLRVWPEDGSVDSATDGSPRIDVDSLRIDSTGADLRGTATDASALSDLVESLGRIPSVDVQPPKFQTTAEDRLRFEVGWKALDSKKDAR